MLNYVSNANFVFVSSVNGAGRRQHHVCSRVLRGSAVACLPEEALVQSGKGVDPAPRPFSCPCRWGRPDALSPASALAWVARKRRHKTRTRSLPFIPFFFHLLALAPCLVGSGASCCLRPAAAAAIRELHREINRGNHRRAM